MNLDGIILHKEITYKFRDEYNAKCNCEQCVLFREDFKIHYPAIVTILESLGIDIDFPIEIVDLGIDDTKLKRGFSAYYAVKGQLPSDDIASDVVGPITISMHNHDYNWEVPSNTSMDPPYFVVEVAGVQLPDNQSVFHRAVDSSRSVYFDFDNKNYVLQKKQHQWSIRCQDNGTDQFFANASDIFATAKLSNRRLNFIWKSIEVKAVK